MLDDVITAYVDGETGEGYAEDWDLDKLWTALGTLYPVGIRWQDVAGEHDDLTRETLIEAVLADARGAYAAARGGDRRDLRAQGGMRELERQVLLQVMDRKWREHLYEMDYLKEGIGLRAMAQRDPLIEYQREGFDMFAAMLEGIKEETVGHLFNVRVQAAAPAPAGRAGSRPRPRRPRAGAAQPAAVQAGRAAAAAGGAGRPRRAAPARPRRHGDGTAAMPRLRRGPRERAARGVPRSAPGRPELQRSGRGRWHGPFTGGGRQGARRRPRRTRAAGGRPSRNRPCPCGSGRKYKQCHGSPTAARP